MMQVNYCTFVQKCSKFNAYSILMNATNSKHKSSTLMTGLAFASVYIRFEVPVLASMSTGVRDTF